MHPRKIQEYENELYEFIKKEERFQPEVYVCSQHVPTIGVGYALLEKAGSTYHVRAGLDEDLAQIGTTLTVADKRRLEILCEMLNEGTIQFAVKGSSLNDPFDLRIDDAQAKQLFLLCVLRYDAVIRQKLGIKLYKDLQNTREMVSLFSLVYNAPSLLGKNIVSALREGNRAKVRYEILYHSNKNLDLGLDNRRQVEARCFGRYDGEIPTVEELKAEEEILNLRKAEIAVHDNAMSAKRTVKSAKRARKPGIASNKRTKPNQPGTVPNQKEVRRQTHEVKAHTHNQGHSILERIMDQVVNHEKLTSRDWDTPPAGLDEECYYKRWA